MFRLCRTVARLPAPEDVQHTVPVRSLRLKGSDVFLRQLLVSSAGHSLRPMEGCWTQASTDLGTCDLCRGEAVRVHQTHRCAVGEERTLRPAKVEGQARSCLKTPCCPQGSGPWESAQTLPRGEGCQDAVGTAPECSQQSGQAVRARAGGPSIAQHTARAARGIRTALRGGCAFSHRYLGSFVVWTGVRKPGPGAGAAALSPQGFPLQQRLSVHLMLQKGRLSMDTGRFNSFFVK